MLFIPHCCSWRLASKGAFLRDWRRSWRWPSALGWVTVVGIGFFVHWLIPAVPLAVAFALAAILSPTDPVAVGAMTATSPLPSRLTHILEGEALLNDATGLVCFTFAVNAALTGQFSLAGAAVSFVLVSGGGVVVGVTVTWAIGRLNRALISAPESRDANPGQPLMPFAVPDAEPLTFPASGSAEAGIASLRRAGRSIAGDYRCSATVWDTVPATLNVIFRAARAALPSFMGGCRRAIELVCACAVLARLLVAITRRFAILAFGLVRDALHRAAAARRASRAAPRPRASWP